MAVMLALKPVTNTRHFTIKRPPPPYPNPNRHRPNPNLHYHPHPNDDKDNKEITFCLQAETIYRAMTTNGIPPTLETVRASHIETHKTLKQTDANTKAPTHHNTRAHSILALAPPSSGRASKQQRRLGTRG